MQEVVRAEVLKLLQAGIIYLISDSLWVSPTQVVPKKSGITVVQNDKGEDVSTHLTTGWRVCIDYMKLNIVTRNDHFPLPFIDQVLERVSGHLFYCFLDGYSGYFQIEIDLEDQEKTTFTCPFVFMDNITVYGSAFGDWLVNLEAVLNRCIEKDSVLNWEKCHFMVQQGIVLGHIISKEGIEVDKAKVELIVKLPSPTNVKGVRQFFGHVEFYRRFIKDFSKLARPLCELLVKDAKFVWDERCQRSFEQLKSFLTTAPIVRAPNWQLPFEVMCNASDFAIGAVLGQRKDGKPYVIYYANKTLNEAQRNYTTTEKELLVDAHAMCKGCDRCQRLGKLTRRNMMPLNPILIVDLFYVWGIDFMGPFPMSVVIKFLKENIFSRFGVPKAIISDGGTHFCNKPFETLLAKYRVKYKVAMPYHPQTKKIDLSNSLIHYGLIELLQDHSWDVLLSLSLWQSVPSPCGLEYKAWWAIKELNMDLSKARLQRFLDLNELEELRHDAYLNSKIAKKRLKRWHDQLVTRKDFTKGQRVLLYDSKLHIFPGKLKSRW
ncbi:Retrovirus-related Pol polyprotein from transposon 17.6 [Vitis vinifera]|uniref:Retrovirus-related Pol polyprotein from transposon 17.6 n=1 Tax=Vitis vinifera TaxID=29760 RepID=A0A438C613_VITVI|nr:Retrovirus-related Pol polyprotein from transposon 17.6 [Vitis vinifera]